MTDGAGTTGWILVVGTVVGLAAVAHPSLVRIWSMPREGHIATVAKHIWVWRALNAGFILATVTTTAGILALSGILYGNGGWATAVLACGIAYGVGGTLWCAVLAIRTRTTPLLDALGTDMLESRGLALLDAALGGLFGFYVALTGVALAALGLVFLMAGGLPTAVGVLTLVTGAGALVWLAIAGDVIPAVLYVPTLVVGISLVAGWT